MWWYRNKDKQPGAGAPTGAPTGAPAPDVPRAPSGSDRIAVTLSPSKGKGRAPGGGGVGPAKADLRPVLRPILAARQKDPDYYLVLSLVVDSRIEMEDGSVHDGISWLDGERLLGECAPTPDPLRLYNRFSREFGDGYSQKTDIPEEHGRILEEIRQAILASPGVRGAENRQLRKSMCWEPSANEVDVVPAPKAE